MKLFSIAAVVAVATGATSAVAEKPFCGQWNLTETDDYTLYNNLWGQSNDTKGTQCTGLDSVKGSHIAWHTSYNWKGSKFQVKSFANAALKFDKVQLSKVKSIPSIIRYKIKSTGKVVANVAYDLFTTSTPDGDAEYEVMVWLAALGGAGPISATGKPIKKVNVGGVNFNLFHGKNGNMTVYSYVALKQTNSFKADFKQFFHKLPTNLAIAPTQYLTHVQAGTEPFIGNATMTVSKYTAAVHTV
ncbi:Cell 12A endoglucanase [Phytophthora megakarya]|uniref:Cell 12A endoglucanase n=1 Tax=Phytophthora megakarya TaxID=4795 RepID=A0A225VW92_9STRA|nr:Cell 12A endoglucanase [Phytophthora megakarya]